MEVPKAVLDMYSNPESDRYDLDKYEELKNSYAFVSSALYGLGHSPRAFHQHPDKWFRDIFSLNCFVYSKTSALALNQFRPDTTA